jgi:nitrite reductase/ring-hydroxylating ferredoxin subunit
MKKADTIESGPMFRKVANIDEIPLGGCKTIEINKKTIAIFNIGGHFYAIDDACPHLAGPLSEGELNGYEVICPIHWSCFDVRSGDVLGPPSQRGVTRYNIQIKDMDIMLEI